MGKFFLAHAVLKNPGPAASSFLLFDFCYLIFFCYNITMSYKFFNKRQLKFIQKGFGYTDRQMQIIELICQNLNNVGLGAMMFRKRR